MRRSRSKRPVSQQSRIVEAAYLAVAGAAALWAMVIVLFLAFLFAYGCEYDYKPDSFESEPIEQRND